MILLLTILLACGTPPAPSIEPVAVVTPVPGDSLYQLDPALVDQHGARVSLGVHRGHPVVVSMFYASCPTACPMLIRDILAFEESLDADERAGLRVLLVSLDPAQDTPERLAEVVETHGLDDARWTLVRSEPDAVREIAAALGIAYRPSPDGGMNHSSVLTLLDRDGVPVARLEGLARDATALRAALTH